MKSPLLLRPAQAEILAYRGGPMAISAVPGAGKTFVLTELVARLVGDPTLAVRPHQILVLTYMRGAATHFKRKAAEVLAREGLAAYGLSCLTIHAFCLAVVRQARAVSGDDEEALTLYQELDQYGVLGTALDELLRDPEVQAEVATRWGSGDWSDPREAIIKAARTVIGAARNHALSVEQVETALAGQPELGALYRAYEERRARKRALDYDALVTEAIACLQNDPNMRAGYQRRYRFVLEDEAQDSTPAQDKLIRLLIDPAWGGSGNLVRVGDSNQAIMTSFTFNDPRFFRAFCARPGWDGGPGGKHVAMQESSRSALPILAVANALAASARQHPEPAVQTAFAGGPIEPASAGKQNPAPGRLPTWRVYGSKDEEQLGVLATARAYLRDQPTHTAAVLLFSRKQVQDYMAKARALDVPLQLGPREQGGSKDVLKLLERVLAFLALPAGDPMGTFLGVLDARCAALGEPWVDARAVRRLLKSGLELESLVYPPGDLPPPRPAELAEADYAAVVFGAKALNHLLAARHLPAGELLPAIANELLDDPEASLVAAGAAKRAERVHAQGGAKAADGQHFELDRTADPLDRLHDFVRWLGAQTNDQREIIQTPTEVKAATGGQLEILTLHRAKGLEFDAVWLPGLGYYNSHREATFFPWYLKQAEIWDQAAFQAEKTLASAASGTPRDLAASRHEAQCLTIAERLRLLYVGVTRAERELHLSCYHAERKDPQLPHVLAMAAQCQQAFA